MERFTGKVAVVTGCSGGIGSAICKELIKRDIIVAGLGRTPEKLEKLARELSVYEENSKKFYPLECDLTVEADIENSFQWITSNLGPIVILINNAGVLEGSLIRDTTAESISKIFDTNVKAAILCANLAIKNMTDSSAKGHIININSIVGRYIGHGNPCSRCMIYTSSKHALNVISEAFRRELVSSNSDIKVTNLSPGLVDTDMAAAMITPSHTSKTLLQPVDVANACVAALNTPPDVLISELTIMPIHQEI